MTNALFKGFISQRCIAVACALCLCTAQLFSIGAYLAKYESIDLTVRAPAFPNFVTKLAGGRGDENKQWHVQELWEVSERKIRAQCNCSLRSCGELRESRITTNPQP